jgi:glycogen(starch) synthase
MKILLSSYFFHPSVGGIESVSKILAEEFAATGNEVRVITESEGDEAIGALYRVARRSSFGELVRHLRWCDFLFQNNVSLRSLIVALLLRKPVLVVHQTWLQNAPGKIGWANRLKRAFLPLVTNFAISRAVADSLHVFATVVGNPYDDAVFRQLPQIARNNTLIFLGRLVSDKGVDLLLQAMKLLRSDGFRPDLTIVGSGPEEESLRLMAGELGLDRQLTFAGEKSGLALAELLNRHCLLIVPSRWPEPFGIVALEAIACGCVVVGSRDGGLPEAIGPCGVTFPNADSRALADVLKRLLTDASQIDAFRRKAATHLAGFRRQVVAKIYLEAMKAAR